MTLLRELGRRRLRTTLTLLGITIGIWALVVFSSMANKINSFVTSGGDYYAGKVIVSDGSSKGIGLGLVPIDLALADRIRTMSGVAAVDPQVQLPVDEAGSGGFSMPRIIVGAVAGADGGRGSPTARERPADLVQIACLLEQGAIRPVIDRSYPLERIRDAHRYVDGGHKVGNVVITLDGTIAAPRAGMAGPTGGPGTPT